MHQTFEVWDKQTIPKDRPLYICDMNDGYSGPDSQAHLIVAIDYEGVCIIDLTGHLRPINHEELARYWVQIDCSPCGMTTPK